MPEQPVEALADALQQALESRRPIPPLTEQPGVREVATAYAVQSAWTRMRVAAGERVVGRKIGLTSRAMQQQLGVHEPDYGTLWATRYFPAQGGRAEMPAGLFLQPRVEGELAFLMGRPLRGPGVTLQQVLASTEAVAVAIEVVDSRIENWRIQLVDTVADNASFGAFTLGPWSHSFLELDLRLVGMMVYHNGQAEVEGMGSAALGHPARCVAWLANKLGEFGVSLQAGDIVLSGALGRAIPAGHGDLFTVQMLGQPPLGVRFV